MEHFGEELLKKEEIIFEGEKWGVLVKSPDGTLYVRGYHHCLTHPIEEFWGRHWEELSLNLPTVYGEEIGGEKSVEFFNAVVKALDKLEGVIYG